MKKQRIVLTTKLVSPLIGFIAFMIVISIFGGPIYADGGPPVLYVATWGNSDSGCGTAEAPCAVLEDVLDKAIAVVKISGGNFTGVTTHQYLDDTEWQTATHHARVLYDVHITGGFCQGNWDNPNPEACPTILNAQNQGRVIAVLPPGASRVVFTMSNTTLISGNGHIQPEHPFGAAIWAPWKADVHLQNVKVLGGSNPVPTNPSFSKSGSQNKNISHAAVVWLGLGSHSINQSEFCGNLAGGGILVDDGGYLRITNSLICQNFDKDLYGGYNLFAQNGSRVNVIASTLVNLDENDYASNILALGAGSVISVTGSIIETSQYAFQGINGGKITTIDTIYRGITAGTIIIDHAQNADPEFVNPQNGIFRLDASSTAHDFVPFANCQTKVDIVNTIRPLGLGCDAGAYEYIEPRLPDLSLQKDGPELTSIGQTMLYTITLINQGGNGGQTIVGDRLPSGLEFAGWQENDFGATFDGQIVGWAGNILADSELRFSFRVTVTNKVTETILNEAKLDHPTGTKYGQVETRVLQDQPVQLMIYLPTIFR